jgi:hypothetical protein
MFCSSLKYVHALEDLSSASMISLHVEFSGSIVDAHN